MTPKSGPEGRLTTLLTGDYTEQTKKRVSLQQKESPSGIHGLVRVESRIVRNVLTEARITSDDKLIRTDEPSIRGGGDSAPTPLGTWVAAFAACTEVHYAEGAALMDMKLGRCEINMRGTFDRRHGGGFLNFSYETRISSSENDHDIKKLVEYAENGCFVLNTLKKALQITGVIYLNGVEIMRRKHGPESRC